MPSRVLSRGSESHQVRMYEARASGAIASPAHAISWGLPCLQALAGLSGALQQVVACQASVHCQHVCQQ